MSWANVAAAGIAVGGSLLASRGGGRSTNQNSSGTSYGSSSSTGTGTGSTSSTGTQTPVVPEGYLPALLGMRPGMDGLTPAQVTALTGMTGQVGSGTRAMANPSYYFSQFADNPATTLEQLYRQYPDMYRRPENVSALTVTPGTGASFMGAYRNPFENDVVAGVVRDLSRARDRRQTARQSELQAAGAFGGSASALEDALIEDDFFNTLGDTVSGLRARNFEFAAGQGQTDASRDLTGQVSNQGATLAADTGNRDAQQQRQMFDVNSANENMRFRGDMAKSWANTNAMGVSLDNAALSALLAGGGVGLGQNLAWLRQFLPLFGSTNTNNTSSTMTETSTGTQSGSHTGTGSGTGPGPSYGSTVGNIGNTLLMMNLLGGMGGNSQPNFGPGGAYPDWTSPWSWA